MLSLVIFFVIYLDALRWMPFGRFCRFCSRDNNNAL